MYKQIIVLLVLARLLSFPVQAETIPPLKIGTLAFGTLNWEIAVIRAEGLDKTHGITIDTVSLAGAEAGKIALQGGSVDLVVGDWLWVARQREQGMDFTFAPYSTSHGALMVPADSPIRGVADLKGKRLGIAGGGLDKNWLLLRALAQKNHGLDLDRAVDKTFGAPPLLNQQLRQGQLDAVLNYWNYAAKLEAQGYRQVLDGREVLKGLGVDADVPALGYIFREAWAKSNAVALVGFFQAADEAKKLICGSDAAWNKVVPLLQDSDEKTRAVLRRRYCAGRVTDFGETEKSAAGTLQALIQSMTGGSSRGLPAGVFWTAPR